VSATVSPVAGKPYGVERVCSLFEQPRSSFYAWRRSEQQADSDTVVIPHKRGPKTAVSDAELLDHIRADLAASPFQGEGYIGRSGRDCASSAKSASRPNGYCG